MLELIDGPPLSELARRAGDRSRRREVAALGAELADALAYIHEQGVVHRDVTPANVLCDPDGRPRLVDFGIARLLDSPRITATAIAIGTAAYMAPEQVAGRGRHAGGRRLRPRAPAARGAHRPPAFDGLDARGGRGPAGARPRHRHRRARRVAAAARGDDAAEPGEPADGRRGRAIGSRARRPRPTSATAPVRRRRAGAAAAGATRDATGGARPRQALPVPPVPTASAEAPSRSADPRRRRRTGARVAARGSAAAVRGARAIVGLALAGDGPPTADRRHGRRPATDDDVVDQATVTTVADHDHHRRRDDDHATPVLDGARPVRPPRHDGRQAGRRGRRRATAEPAQVARASR